MNLEEYKNKVLKEFDEKWKKLMILGAGETYQEENDIKHQNQIKQFLSQALSEQEELIKKEYKGGMLIEDLQTVKNELYVIARVPKFLENGEKGWSVWFKEEKPI